MVVIVSDGASTNRKFFKLHKSSDCTRDGIVTQPSIKKINLGNN